jgi:hypothetical protein
MGFKMVVKFMLPVEQLCIMLKTQFVVCYKVYLKNNLWSVQNYALQIAYQNEIHSKLNHQILIL